MSLFSLPTEALAGDIARRRASRCLLLGLVATSLACWLFISIETLWRYIEPLEGAAFFVSAALYGGVLACTPTAAAVGWLLALWFGVESVYLARVRATPYTDRLIVGLGIVVWSVPALGFLATAIRALITGSVHFVRPPRDYLLATDPIAYWEGVGFLLIMGAIFAWGAWRYWQGKLARARG